MSPGRLDEPILVLSRKASEVIVINGGTPDEIRIMVVNLSSERAGIGIVAPKHMTIDRLEVHNRKLESSNGKS